MQPARRMVRIAALALVIPLTACQSVSSPPHLITIAKPAMAGEALFRGELAEVAGCVVAKGHRDNATILFDRGVTLLPRGDGVFDPATGNSIRFGARITGGAAVVRDAGQGWPIHDIERFYGVTIPAACPKSDVMRLHHMEIPEA